MTIKTAAKETPDLEAQVDRVLDEMRPYIHSHGGEVNVLEVTEEGVARIQMIGSCNGCPMSMLTMRLGIERLLAENSKYGNAADVLYELAWAYQNRDQRDNKFSKPKEMSRATDR